MKESGSESDAASSSASVRSGALDVTGKTCRSVHVSSEEFVTLPETPMTVPGARTPTSGVTPSMVTVSGVPVSSSSSAAADAAPTAAAVAPGPGAALAGPASHARSGARSTPSTRSSAANLGGLAARSGDASRSSMDRC